MGCCVFQAKETEWSFSIPEQEIVISQLESAHPFRKVSAKALFTVLSAYKKSKLVSNADLVSICQKLSIDPGHFTNSAYFIPFKSTQTDSEMYDFRSLSVILMLITKSQWSSKLKRLFDIYSCDSTITEPEFRMLIQDIIHASSTVSPSIALNSLPKYSVSQYVSKLNNGKTLLFHKITQEIEPPFSSDKAMQVFIDKPELQKLLWASGVRIMMIEQDLLSKTENPRRVESRTSITVESNA